MKDMAISGVGALTKTIIDEIFMIIFQKQAKLNMLPKAASK